MMWTSSYDLNIYDYKLIMGANKIEWANMIILENNYIFVP
jgi:hypothetical protein